MTNSDEGTAPLPHSQGKLEAGIKGEPRDEDGLECTLGYQQQLCLEATVLECRPNPNLWSKPNSLVSNPD